MMMGRWADGQQSTMTKTKGANKGNKNKKQKKNKK
jgi:hypothetical protein